MGSDQNQHISMDLHVTLLDKILHQDDEMYVDNFKALMVCNLYAGPTHVSQRGHVARFQAIQMQASELLLPFVTLTNSPQREW